MRLDAGELVQHHAESLGARGDFQPEQLFGRQAVGEVVGHRAEIIDAVGEGDYLLVELGLAGLFNAGVQVADVGRAAYDGFAVDFEHEAQHTVRAGVLGTHVEDHGVVAAGVFAAVALGIVEDGINAGIDLIGCGRGHGVTPGLDAGVAGG